MDCPQLASVGGASPWLMVGALLLVSFGVLAVARSRGSRGAGSVAAAVLAVTLASGLAPVDRAWADECAPTPTTPTEEPAERATDEPADEPSDEPTDSTDEPVDEPTDEPTAGPSRIDAVDDDLGSVSRVGGGVTESVLANDTLDGAPVAVDAVTLTPGAVPAGLTLNPDGTVTVAAGTPPGVYEVGYTICHAADPGDCDTAAATVRVAGVPDLALEMSSSVAEITIGQPLQVFYRVTNVGDDVTDGSVITLTALKPAGMNTFTPLVTPAGWSVAAVGNNFVFTTTKAMAVADSDVIVIEYTSTDTVPGIGRAFVGRVANGSGGEVNAANNVDSFTLVRQVG